MNEVVQVVLQPLAGVCSRRRPVRSWAAAAHREPLTAALNTKLQDDDAINNRGRNGMIDQQPGIASVSSGNWRARRLKWQLVAALMIAGAGCGSDEPTTEQIRGTFERNRGTFEELRRLFAADVKSHRVVEVSAGTSAGTRCRERDTGLSCLEESRWREYSSKMEPVGIREIELHRETPGVYFHIYRSTWDMWRGEFRFRGVVYAPGSPTVTHDHDDTEERVDFGDGWYAFLIVDS